MGVLRCRILHETANVPYGGVVPEQALVFAVIRPLRSCQDSFGCVHIHFDDEAPPTPNLIVRGAHELVSNRADEDRATLTLTIPAAAELLGISLNKAYEAVRLGQIPTIRIGARVLVSRRRLEEMVDGLVQ